MARCATCGNEYERCMDVKIDGASYTFDCFECAIHKLAPVCAGCGCRILGHGVQVGDRLFCSGHCARHEGIRGITTHISQPGAS